ncbi:MAG: hypothetical protein D6694_01765, partial [Gammaproteobacteria bacterium]
AQSWVRDIVQTTDGQIWVATENGLSRLDGHHAYTYRFQPDQKHSLPGNTVWDLALDAQGQLWVATSGGVGHYRPATDDFQVVFDQAALNKHGAGIVYQIVSDKGVLWMLADGGLLQYKGTDDYRLLKPKTEALPLARPYRLFRINGVGMLAADEAKGIWRWDTEAQQWRPWASQAFLDIVREKRFVIDLIPDGEQRIIAVLDAGYLVFDDTGTIVEQFRPYVQKAPEFRAQSGMRTPDRELWVGLRSGGVLRISLPSGKRRHIHRWQRGKETLPSVRALFRDRDGNIWLGTEGEGTLVWNKRSEWPVRLLPGEHGQRNKVVWSILPASDGALWLGGDRALEVRPESSTEFQPIYTADDRRLLQGVYVVTEFQNQIMAGTGRGLWQVDGKTRTAKPVHWTAENGESPRWLSRVVFTLYADGQRLWIGHSDGWGVYDKASGRVLSLSHVPELCRALTTAFEASERFVYIGTDRAVCRYDKTNGTVEVLPGLDNDGIIREGASVTDMQLGGKYLLVGYSGIGLKIYDLKEKKVVLASGLGTGLASNNVAAIATDSRGRLWLPSQTGLTV